MEVDARERLEKAELEAILASGVFAKSPNLAKLLNYVCEKYWEGKTDHIKEYNLAVEALGRPPDFDPAESAIVRVEAFRLREKLKKYYEHEGAGHQVVITLQPGRYVPRFVFSTEEFSPRAAQPGIHIPAASMESAGAALVPVHNQEVQRLTGDDHEISAASVPSGGKRNFPALRWFIVGGAILVAILIGAIALLRVQSIRSAAPGPAPTASNRVSPIATAAEQAGVRIIAGYSRKSYIGRSGETWRGDAYFHGGGAGESPSQFIARTSDPTLFQTNRHGEFSYDIPLKPGAYELWLYFVETLYGPGTIQGGGETSRIFDVQANGRTILSAFDVFADAGGNFIADARVFKNIMPSPDGYLHIQFIRRTENPFINAIKVVPTAPGKLQPIRIVAQDDSYTDHNDRKWDPDRFYLDGRLVTRHSSVSGTLDPGLFAGERYGNFDYSIPVAAGRYALTLYFSERYFGTGKDGGGGVDSRVFDVLCNGNTLLKNFDIFKEAGGADRALVKTFHGLSPDAQGKLRVRFVPIMNYALVDAIEVTDESR